MADTDQSLYNLRYNQVAREMEGFGGGSPMWTPLVLSGSGVSSINGLTNDVVLLAGTNITLTPVGQNITIDAAGGGAPSGNNDSIQFNDGGSFNGIDTFTSDATNLQLSASSSFVFAASDNATLGTLAAISNVMIISSTAALRLQTDDSGSAWQWNFNTDGSLTPPNLPTDPVSPSSGTFWFNSTSHTWRGFDGTNLGTFTFVAD